MSHVRNKGGPNKFNIYLLEGDGYPLFSGGEPVMAGQIILLQFGRAEGLRVSMSLGKGFLQGTLMKEFNVFPSSMA